MTRWTPAVASTSSAPPASPPAWTPPPAVRNGCAKGASRSSRRSTGRRCHRSAPHPHAGRPARLADRPTPTTTRPWCPSTSAECARCSPTTRHPADTAWRPSPIANPPRPPGASSPTPAPAGRAPRCRTWRCTWRRPTWAGRSASAPSSTWAATPQATEDCILDLGFTEPCAQIWVFNSLNTREACLVECLDALNKPSHLPDGSLNACLACDEANSGPVFKAVAGRTRRNSGIPSAICRPGDSVEAIYHDDYP